MNWAGIGAALGGSIGVVAARSYASLRASIRLLLVVGIALSCIGCGYFVARVLSGTEVPAPHDFSFVGERTPCYLELRKNSKALRVNCFHLEGVLHIHSSRWAKLPRLSGQSWIATIRRTPEVRVEIDQKIYSLRAVPIDNESLRKKILHNRGYAYAWDGITIVRFIPHESLAANDV